MELQLFEGTPLTKLNIEAMATQMVGSLETRDQLAEGYVKAKALEELSKQLQERTKEAAIDFSREKKELGGAGVAYVKPTEKIVYEEDPQLDLALQIRDALVETHKAQLEILNEKIEARRKHLRECMRFSTVSSGEGAVRVTLPKG